MVERRGCCSLVNTSSHVTQGKGKGGKPLKEWKKGRENRGASIIELWREKLPIEVVANIRKEVKIRCHFDLHYQVDTSISRRHGGGEKKQTTEEEGKREPLAPLREKEKLSLTKTFSNGVRKGKPLMSLKSSN